MDISNVLHDIANNVHDPVWLDNHLDELYAVVKNRLKKKIGWEEVVRILLYIMPAIIDRPEAKPWGRLVEQAYDQSPYAELDGLDGIKTMEQAGFFSIQKREKILQLPTKTTRRKRLITHPTQTLEMHIIFFMSIFYRKATTVTDKQIEDLIYYARVVNDPYTSNKMHLALAFLYTNRYEPDMALPHAEIAYRYWEHRDTFDAGLSAYALALCLSSMNQTTEAYRWTTIAAEKFAQTDHKSQYGAVALLNAHMNLSLGNDKEATEWAVIAIDNFKQINSSIYTAHSQHVLGVAQAYMGEAKSAMYTLQDARNSWASAGDPSMSIHTMISLATLQGYTDDIAAARETLQTVHEKVNALDEGDMRSYLQDLANKVSEMLDNNHVTLEHITPRVVPEAIPMQV